MFRKRKTKLKKKALFISPRNLNNNRVEIQEKKILCKGKKPFNIFFPSRYLNIFFFYYCSYKCCFFRIVYIPVYNGSQGKS